LGGGRELLEVYKKGGERGGGGEQCQVCTERSRSLKTRTHVKKEGSYAEVASKRTLASRN